MNKPKTRIRAVALCGVAILFPLTITGCGAYGHNKRGGRIDQAKLAALIQQLKDDSPTVRKNAAEGIREMQLVGDVAIPAIAPLIENFADVKGQLGHSDEKIRAEAKLARDYAAEAFSSIHTEATVAPLAEACRSTDPKVRAMAFYAIGSVPIDIKNNQSKQILDVQVKGLQDSDGEARYYVAYAWDKSLCIMNEDIVPPILDALKVEHREFQCFLLRALSHMGPRAKAGIPVFEAMSKHSDPLVASVAQRALSQARQSPDGGAPPTDDKQKPSSEPERKNAPAKPESEKNPPAKAKD